MSESLERLDRAVQERLRGMSRDRLLELIPRAINGRFRLCIPPEPDDDDLILAALIDEVLAGRAVLAAAALLAEQVRAWSTLPYTPGQDEEYATENGQAEDMILDALTQYDAARQQTSDPA